MVRASVRTAGDTVLRRSPAQLVMRRRSASGLAVLAYHGVDDAATFARQLDHLRDHATPVSLEEVLAATATGAPLPRSAVLVTFDDGHRSVLERGLPLLRERGIPAVAFVIPGLLDTDTPFWWEEVRALHDAGARLRHATGLTAAATVGWLKTVPEDRRGEEVDLLRAERPEAVLRTPQLRSDELLELREGGVAIGNHTWSHPCLDRCTETHAISQVDAAHDRLVSVLGEGPLAFAYPNGNRDVRVEPRLHELGYRAVFLFDHRVDRQRGGWVRSRLRVSSDTPADRFAIVLSGLHSALHRARGGS